MLLLQYAEVTNMRQMDATHDTSEQSVLWGVSALQYATNTTAVSEERMYSLNGMNKFLMKMFFLMIPAQFHEKQQLKLSQQFEI